MELSAFAERVLYGKTLEDKLVPLGRPTDRVRGPAYGVPARPGRAPEWPLRDGRAKSAVPNDLRSDADRARVLHAFAVHELLALELLALALLRWPTAEPRLRRAWAVTAADEQRHLRLYLQRLAEAGARLGEWPASAFFWDALANSPEPAAFTVGLGLVLEQANLDHARVWRARFAEAGDPRTADVLAEVLADEIRHVRVAAATLETIRAEGESSFDAFVRTVQFPLGPARAKGPDPQRDVRISAGLSEAFVDRLLVWGMSTGRDPDVFLFDAHVEDAVCGRPVQDSPIECDLACLPMWLASPDDVVLGEPPRDPYLLELAAAGVRAPRFAGTIAEIPRERRGRLRPWGWTPRTAARLDGVYDPRSAVVHDRTWAVGLAGRWTPPAWVGVVCATPDEVEAAMAGRRSWIKARFGTAGSHRMCVDRLDERARVWLGRTLSDGPVVVEPHFDVVAELSVQGEVESDVRILGITRFWARAGVYGGSVVGRPEYGCDPDVVRFLHTPRGGAGFDVLRAAAEEVGSQAKIHGFRGPFGVDAMVVRSPEGLVLRPISEVNGRFTMGRVALAFRRRLAAGSVGAWFFVPRRAVGPDWRTDMRVERGRWLAGTLSTTDPVRAHRLTTWVVVDRSWPELLGRAGQWGLVPL